VSNKARRVVAKFLSGALPEGEVVKKFIPTPKQKPPRRRPGIKNKSNRSDYMKEYMTDYRKEQGKDFQKTPDAVKKFRAEQRKRLKEKFNLKKSTSVSI
jgi:hypothetical protein